MAGPPAGTRVADLFQVYGAGSLTQSHVQLASDAYQRLSGCSKGEDIARILQWCLNVREDRRPEAAAVVSELLRLAADDIVVTPNPHSAARRAIVRNECLSGRIRMPSEQ